MSYDRLTIWIFGAVLCLFASACAPHVTGLGPTIAAPTLESERIVAADGTVLNLRSWQAQRPRALVLALHGFNDYSHAFEDVGQYLSAQNIGVYAYDQRGFGKNNERGRWAGQAAYVNDARAAIMLLKDRYPDVPLFLLGESMGGAVALLAISDAPASLRQTVEGVILVAPAVWGWTSMNGLYASMLRLLAHTLPGDTLSNRGLKIMATDNRAIMEEMSRDPLIIRATRVDAVYGLVDLMENASKAAHKIEEPVLLLYGLKDQIIPGPAIYSAFSRSSVTADASLKKALYPSGYHMLLRDLNGKAVWQDIEDFVSDASKALRSGFEVENLDKLKLTLPPR